MTIKSTKFKSVSPIGPECNKTMYNSLEEAEDMIRYIQEDRIVSDLRTYKCDDCGMWHLTSKSKRESADD